MHPLRSTIRTLLLGAGVAPILLGTAYAQINDSIRGEPSEANHFVATPDGWEHPMTPWGEPDIRAKLDMMQASRVPLERCASSYRFGAPPCDMDKKWLTDEEYQAAIEQWAGRVDTSRQALLDGNIALSLRTGLVDPNIPQRQTNLIVDPPDGRLPALTPEGKRRAPLMGSDWALPGETLTFDGPEDFDSWDRCITRGMPSSMMPYRYNGGFFIEQAPGYVIFRLEMIHEARIIPTTPVEQLPPEIKQWMGQSRGRWEGNTLVVETTNYQEGPPMINLAVVGSPPGNRFPISDQMKTTERIVRLNDDTWLYEITTEDPVILTDSFTVRYPMRHDPDYLMPEYACHEDNTIVRNYVETNRHERAHPPPMPEEPLDMAAAVADALEGRWIGRPRIVTIDLDIELEFTKRADDVVVGRLVGTTLGEIDRPLRSVAFSDGVLKFELPNWQPWSFAGQLTDDGTLVGVVGSEQGGVPVTFTRATSE